MCGRFALKTPALRIREALFLDNTPVFDSRYNISPSQMVLAAWEVAGRREGLMMRWGLIPSWAKDEAIGNRMINARAESLTEKPAFRESFRHRRCLIPADGFYEWKPMKGKGKQPFFIRRRDSRIMALAGLWDRWDSPQGRDILSCAIITIDAGPDVATIHNRMPLILQPEAFDLWLCESAGPERLRGLFQPPPESTLMAYPVDRRVNTPEADSPECIAPIEIESPPPELF